MSASELSLSLLQKPFLGYRAEGLIKYIGAVPEEGPGIWIGLELDQAVGVNDGLDYFPCKTYPSSHGPFHGVFVRGSQIEFTDRMTEHLHKEGVRQVCSPCKIYSMCLEPISLPPALPFAFYLKRNFTRKVHFTTDKILEVVYGFG